LTESVDVSERACFTTANGETFVTLGQIALPVGIYPTSAAVKPVPFGVTEFYVLDRSDSKVILGMDWLYKNKVVFDVCSSRVSVTSPFGWV